MTNLFPTFKPTHPNSSTHHLSHVTFVDFTGIVEGGGAVISGVAAGVTGVITKPVEGSNTLTYIL